MRMLSRRILSAAVALVVPLASHAGDFQFEDFDRHVTVADSLYDAGDYLLSAEAYDAAFALQEGSSANYYNAACSWSLAGDSRRALDALERAAEAGHANPEWMESDSDLDPLHGEPEWRELLARAQANLDEIEKDYDKPLKHQLEQLYVRDQTLRQLWQSVEETFGGDSDEMRYYSRLMLREDSLCVEEVLEIIETRGWPGTSLVGGRANAAVWLVIQHAPIDVQERYLPLFRKSVAGGESLGRHLALLEDRILMRNGRPQVYGSQIRTNPETGEHYLYLVDDPRGVNERRASVGLGAIEEYIARWDIVWDPNAMAARLSE